MEKPTTTVAKETMVATVMERDLLQDARYGAKEALELRHMHNTPGQLHYLT